MAMICMPNLFFNVLACMAAMHPPTTTTTTTPTTVVEYSSYTMLAQLRRGQWLLVTALVSAGELGPSSSWELDITLGVVAFRPMLP